MTKGLALQALLMTHCPEWAVSSSGEESGHLQSEEFHRN